MKSGRERFTFDRARGIVTFGDEVVVDMSRVPKKANSVIYSNATIDFSGYETELTLNATSHPFDIQITSFSPADLIQAIVENRLEVEGMVVTEAVYKAYDYLWENGLCKKEL